MNDKIYEKVRKTVYIVLYLIIFCDKKNYLNNLIYFLI